MGKDIGHPHALPEAEIPLLGMGQLASGQQSLYQAAAAQDPVILQIGEGNFLRGFVGWMLEQCRKQGLFSGGVAVVQPRPSGKAKIEKLARQDGLYTLVTRGITNGQQIESAELVTIYTEAFDPYNNWKRLVAIAESPALQFIVSNTTEAGIAYSAEPLIEGQPIQSYPGKLAYLLYRRFIALGPVDASELTVLPCELVDNNGDRLKAAVTRYCEEWRLPPAFMEWMGQHVHFLNTLVDRIVTGYPDPGTADAWMAQWGYRDEMLTVSEPYYFWAIEAGPELDSKLPLRRAGLNVEWVADLSPYQLRKVRILNGTHTMMALIGQRHGIEYVRDVMEHPEWRAYIKEAVEQEIIPAIGLPAEECAVYAAQIYERFLNPYINHKLADIALNSISKFKSRLWPVLEHYLARGEQLPSKLVQALAYLLLHCRVVSNGGEAGGYSGTRQDGSSYEVRDNPAELDALAAAWKASREVEAGNPAGQAESLIVGQSRRLLQALSGLWDCPLAASPILVQAVADQLVEMGAGENG